MLNDLCRSELHSFTARCALDGSTPVVTVSSSSNSLDQDTGAYIGGIRQFSSISIISLVISSEEFLLSFLTDFAESFDFIFVEIEKRIAFNLNDIRFDSNNLPLLSNLYQFSLEHLRSRQLSHKLKTYKPSDITIQSSLMYIRHFMSLNKRIRTVSILGSGNIGSKLALALVEEGINVNIWNRTKAKSELCSQFINNHTTFQTISKCIPFSSIDSCLASQSICVSTVSQAHYLDFRYLFLLADPSLFLDVGKNALIKPAEGTEFSQLKTSLLRCDITSSLISYIFSSIHCPSLNWPSFVTDSQGRRFIEPGILGFEGDTLVESIQDPPYNVIGIVNKDGRVSKADEA